MCDVRTFQPITYSELLRRHSTPKGISPSDNSVQVVAGKYEHDLFSGQGDTLNYSMSSVDRAGNTWLDGQVGSKVKVHLNLKYERIKGSQYFFCGEYDVHARAGRHWRLSRAQAPVFQSRQRDLRAWLRSGDHVGMSRLIA